MKKKSNFRVEKKSPDMVLRRTFRGTKAIPVSPATQGLAHKLRTLSVPIIDIRKDNSLHNLGLEEQGHGVWRFNSNPKSTRYHRHIRTTGNREEIPSTNGDNENSVGRRGSDSGPKRVLDGLGEKQVAPSEVKKSLRRNAAKAMQVIDISSDDEESFSVCELPSRVRDRKIRVSAIKSDESVDKKVSYRVKNKNSNIHVDTEKQSPSELKCRTSRKQAQIASTNENDLNMKGKKPSAEVSPENKRDRTIAMPLGLNNAKKIPKVLVKHVESPLKGGVSRLKSPGKKNESKELVVKNKGLRAQKKNDEAQSNLLVKKYGLRSVVSSEASVSGKRKGDDISPTDDISKPVKAQRLQDKKSEGGRKKSITTPLTISSKKEKSSPKAEVNSSKKKAFPKKRKSNSESIKGDKDDVDFKVSPSTSADGNTLPKLKLTRKHQSKFQIHWCEICGVELHSIDNKLEHEFSHLEPRQLHVSLHRCYLTNSSVKLPIYVSREDLAAIPDPKEDTSSPVASDDDSHPLLPTENILNEKEENAYDSWSSSGEENGYAETEKPLADDSTQEPSPGDPNTVSPAATPERNTPVKSPRLLASRDRSKRKSQVKMRLWEGPPVTRSGRVVKISQKKKECLEQVACVRVLFSKNQEVEDGGECSTTVKEKESVMAEKLAEEESVVEEKSMPLVDEYVEVVVMKGDLKDIVESDAKNSEPVNDKCPKRDGSSSADLSSTEEIKVPDPNSEPVDALETEGNVSTDNSTIEMKFPVETEEVNDKPNENNCISSGDNESDGSSLVEKEISPENTEANDALETEDLVSTESSSTDKVETPVETEELNGEQNENDRGCILSGDIMSEVEEINNSVRKDDAIENGCNTTPDMNQNIMHEVESDETLEKLTGSLTGEIIEETQEAEACARFEESILSSDDSSEQKAVKEGVEESKISESDNLELDPERDPADLIPENRIGMRGLLEDANDDNSKDVMLVDESNDVMVGGTFADNVEMQETSEIDYVSVPSDLGSKLNIPVDQELEDISDDDWADISDKEMEESPQYANGHLGDVEMDEGPASCIDNLGQEGEMDLEETEKDNGLPDQMCTGEVLSETLEEEMKDLENTEDEIMAENAVVEMAGVLSPKDSVNMTESGELAAEVDMTETVEEPEDGCMAEVIDTIQEVEEALGSVREKVIAEGQASLEGESAGVDTLESFREEGAKEHVENESTALDKEEDLMPSNVSVEKEVDEVPAPLSDSEKIPVNGIELVAVVGSGEVQGSDKNSGHLDEPAETPGNMFAEECKAQNVGVFKECGSKVKKDLCVSSRTSDQNTVTLGHGNEISHSN